MKVGALVRLANLSVQAGRIEEARGYFERTGLGGRECTLVDARPRKTGGNIGNNDYPLEAVRWGMGGWAVAEYDILPAGSPAHIRPIVAFPPFVFGEPTARTLASLRYEQSYRPQGSQGCGGFRQRVNYRFKAAG